MTVQEWLGKDNIFGEQIFAKKYQYNNETLDEWFDRVSSGNPELRRIIKDKLFLFGGRALSNLNTGNNSSFFNCYSKGFVQDNLSDIMQANTDIALTYKAQGGQGLSLSKLRPKGTPIGKQYSSDGIIPFMKMYNETTSTISQGGSRKGALMISLDCRHKEAEEFIKIKSNDTEIKKANLSLEVDDGFMQAVQTYYETGKEIILHEVREYGEHKIEYDVCPIKIYKLMCQTCYEWAEPAMLYTERFRNYNLMEFVDDYKIETSNPCGEQPLPKDFCCNLGSINLAELVKNKFTDTSEFDFKEFKNVIRISVTALDDIIDKNLPFHALPQQAENSKNYRNIGLGVFGYADMLMMLKLKYGSDEAIEFTEKLFKFLFVESVLASNSLAKEKGTFPKYEETLFSSSIIKKHFTEKQISELKKDGLRNCSLISIAPTGSISNLLGRSGGCEPEYAISYKRKTESLNNGEDKYFDIYCQTAKEYISEFGENLPDYFICSNDIPYKTRIITQGIMQNSVDTAISSTVNLPKSTTLKQVEDLYLLAWQYGLKGVTIFRDGCKKTGIISTATKKEEPEKQKFDYIEPISKDTIGETYGTNVKKRIACGKLYLNICRDKDGNLAEMFVNTGKGGICQSNINAISRLVSISLRSGIKVEEIAEQLRGIICPACTKVMTKGEKLSGASCPDVIARTLLEEYNKEEIIIRKPKRSKAKTKEVLPVEEFDASMICPDCGAKLHMDGGCNICVGDETHIGCGYSKCG